MAVGRAILGAIPRSNLAARNAVVLASEPEDLPR